MSAVTPDLITLRGSLAAHKVFTADGWGRGELECEQERMPITVVGKLLNVRVGDTIEVIGTWVDSPKFGRQFKTISCTPAQPKTALGVVRWMASRLPDVGENRARELVDKFGDELWTVIEHEPHRLTEVNGITTERAAAIAEAYAKVSGERVHMSTLRGWGLTDHQVSKCVAAWGALDIVVDRVRADPFELAQVVDGFGFKKADRVARAMGIAPDAPGRVRAGILHTLNEGALQGHCFLWGEALRNVSAALLGVPTQLVVQQIFAVCEMNRVVRRGARVYSVKLDRAEQKAAELMSVMLKLGEIAA